MSGVSVFDFRFLGSQAQRIQWAVENGKFTSIELYDVITNFLNQKEVPPAEKCVMRDVSQQKCPDSSE